MAGLCSVSTMNGTTGAACTGVASAWIRSLYSVAPIGGSRVPSCSMAAVMASWITQELCMQEAKNLLLRCLVYSSFGFFGCLGSGMNMLAMVREVFIGRAERQ